MEFLILNALSLGFLLGVFTPCKSDDAWKRWNSSMYFFSGYEDPGLRLNHISAANYCTALGATLASVLSEQENEFVVQSVAISDFFHWAGLEYTSDTLPEGCKLCSKCNYDNGDIPSDDNNCRLCQECQYDPGWIWSDGHTVTWRNWHMNQPNEKFRCVKIQSGSTGKWYDADCSDRFPFICKKTEGSSTPSAREEGSTAGDDGTHGTPMHVSSGSNNIGVIVGVVVAFIVILTILVLVIIGIILFRKRRGRSEKYDDDNVYYNDNMQSHVYYNDTELQPAHKPLQNQTSVISEISPYSSSANSQYPLTDANDNYQKQHENYTGTTSDADIYAEPDIGIHSHLNYNSRNDSEHGNTRVGDAASGVDVAALYAVPDKGKHKSNTSSIDDEAAVDIDALYAVPDKTKKKPAAIKPPKPVRKKKKKPKTEEQNQNPSASDMNTGNTEADISALYAQPMKKKHNLNS